jgi:molybdopterin synthase sulfur carrier subunit
MSATVTVDYFAWVRERIGKEHETITLPEAATPLSIVLDYLQQRGGGYADALADRDQLKFAVNENYVPDTFLVSSGDRLAIFPPVTGG